MSKSVKQLLGNFIWMWDHRFFVETPEGNFIWSCPDYNGDNSLTPYEKEYADFCEEVGIDFGRDKGTHLIESYCGPDVWVKKGKD